MIPIKQDGLAHISYFVASKGEAVVIDQRRDVDIYVELAMKTGTNITMILETHRNEDYVIGSIELKEYFHKAIIGHSDQTGFEYGDMNIRDGEVFNVGQMRIVCLNTPGHTYDSMCYLFSDLSVSQDPILCFSGDTLFVNDVGRTDLVNPALAEVMARELYSSIHEKLMKLDDGVILYPGHGSGSVCGGEIAERDFTTIGFERRHNPLLQLPEDDFVKKVSKRHLTTASYFKHCERLNTIGPPLLIERGPPRRLSIDEFEALSIKQGTVIIDARSHDAFITAHIPDSINIPLNMLGMVGGWIIKPEEHVILVLSRDSDIDLAYRYFVRIGYDNIIGYLATSISGWISSGRSIRSLRIKSPNQVIDDIDNGRVSALDVRETNETLHEPVSSSLHVPLTSIRNWNGENLQKPIITLCPIGVRATIAASILRHNGIENVYVAFGGIKALQNENNLRKGVE